MCCCGLLEKEYTTPCGVISGPTIKTFLVTFEKIIKVIIARSLYALYTFLVVWRVTLALNDESYWSLLFCISLVGMETLHTIVWRKGGELKWVTPSVFFYLVCAVPSIWLLELKLLADRQSFNGTDCSSGSSLSPTSVSELTLTDDDWTLAMEQILIFVLVFGKWIAPKGELSRDELSQLLLVYLGTGADIMELLESFNEDKVSNNADIVYLVMSIWSWSLLQFCIVPTATKQLPDVDKPLKPEDFDSINSEHSRSGITKISNPQNGHTRTRGESSLRSNGTIVKATDETNKTSSNNKDQRKTGNNKAIKQFGSSNKVGAAKDVSIGAEKTKKQQLISSKQSDKSVSKNRIPNDKSKPATITVKSNQNVESKKHNPPTAHTYNQHAAIGHNQSQWDHEIIVIHDSEDNLKIEDTANEWIAGKRCCTSFCFYNEVWSMVLSLAFQDGPFLITRLVIMFHYQVVSHMTVFFTFKNIVTIILILNRIRVVVLEDHSNWKTHMREVKKVRKRNGELLREKRRRELRELGHHSRNEGQQESLMSEDDSKSKKTVWRKPKWLFWRS